jgi:hypothetical protein
MVVVMIAVVIAIAVMIVVVIVPVAVGVPAMAVFVPPPVRVRPAVFTGLVQLLARVYHLPAVPAVMFRGFVQPMIGFGDFPLACPFVGASWRRTHENEGARQRCGGKTGPQPKRFYCMNLHCYSSLLKIHRYRVCNSRLGSRPE